MNSQQLPKLWKWRFRCAAIAVVGLAFFSAAVLAADSTLLSGEALRQALAQKVSVTWSNLAARPAVERFCRAQKLAVVLDRRIDPDRKIELTLDNAPLGEALARIAAKLDADCTLLGSVAYFGPSSITKRLQTLAALRKDDVARLPPATRLRWTQLKPWKWDDLAQPRELLTALGKENGIQIEGLAQIPHDLWAAVELPPLGLADRLTLVLAQFDLTFEPASDGQSIRIVPAPDVPVIEHTYTVAGSAQDLAAQLKKKDMLAGAEIKATGNNKLTVRGRQEDQDTIADLLAGRTAKRTTVTEGQKVYTLKVTAPVSKLLNSVGKQLDLDIQIDRLAVAQAGISLEQNVELDVKEASADKLFHAILDPAGLKFTRHENVVEVTAK